MQDFAREAHDPAKQTDLEHLRELVKLRREYVHSLATEIKLKQAERGVLGYLFGIKRR
jgi:hypothetical protein